MPDAERPPQVIAIDQAARGERGTATLSPAEVARRLAALERQVEQALAGNRTAPESGTLLGVLLDEALAAYSDVRRWLSGEVRAELSPLGELGRRLLYRLWWRVDVVGRERVPPAGRVLLAVNRAGTLVPYAALMVAEAFDAPERPAVPLVDRALLGLPLVGPSLAACGARPSASREVRAVLRTDGMAVVMPEGPAAVGKPWPLRYRLAPFGHGPLLRAAVETGAPIVPVAAIGSEETQPTVLRVEALGRLVGLPAIPVTPTLLPLPTKWTLYVGEPIDVPGRWHPAAAGDPEVLRTLRARVREQLQAVVGDGLRRRGGVFR